MLEQPTVDKQPTKYVRFFAPFVAWWDGCSSLGKGILFITLSMFCFSLTDSSGKWLTERHDPMMVVWARFVAQLFWTVVFFGTSLRRMMRTDNLKLHMFRSVMMFQIAICFFMALALLPIAEVTAIFEIGPLLITVMAFFFLKEHVGIRRWIGVGCGFIGALVIIRPGSDVFSWAALLPVLAAIGYATYIVSTRAMASREGPWASFIYVALFGSVGTSVLVPFFWSTPSWIDAATMLFMGLAAGASHLLLIFAYRECPASSLAPFGYAGLMFNTMWGLVLFGEVPDYFTIIGALIIVCAGLYVWWREKRVNRAG